MTVVDEHTRPHEAPDGSRRERGRRELAQVLEYEPTDLPDAAHLRDDLNLDSLAMMTLLTWLESRGVVATGQRARPATVGDVLNLLNRSAPDLSVRVTDGVFGSLRATDISVVPVADGPATEAASPLAPVLGNAELRLTPVEPDDTRFLYTLASHPDTCYRWRYRGAPPSIDRFMADLWSQVLVQFVVRRAEDGEPVGHLVAYGADLGQGYAYLGAVFRPPYSGTGLGAQATMMFVRYMFHTHALRKLYVEVPGFNWPQVCSGEGRLFEVEGIMRDHEFYAGRHWDRYLCAIYPKN
ncbi:GNAT family N-acetyltransferase [Micromonospora sp. DT31]|uniref:GNAT family N-acetyltransferase n=1 Tax=Micromonospora sp. DT31 TaxID=3393434 RepID=UPI003CF2E760